MSAIETERLDVVVIGSGLASLNFIEAYLSKKRKIHVISPDFSLDLSKSEEAKLNSIIQQAHNNGQKLRFWATPDTPSSWSLFYNAGVDFINTDKLESFAKFLREKRSK